MAVGKYSPTITRAYMKSQTWWKGVDEFSLYDQDGYDSYGYNKENVDRAGNHENEYLNGQDDGMDGWEYPLYEDTGAEWGVGPDGFPVLYADLERVKEEAAQELARATESDIQDKIQHTQRHAEMKSKVRFVRSKN